MKLSITLAQSYYLQKLVNADMARMDKGMDHALCYGTEVLLPDYEHAKAILHEVYLIQSSLPDVDS